MSYIALDPPRGSNNLDIHRRTNEKTTGDITHFCL